MDYLSYREQLGIGFNDTQKCEYFFVKIFNKLNSMEGYITYEEYAAFCNLAGIVMQCEDGDNEYEMFSDCIRIFRDSSTLLNDFLADYICFVNCLSARNRIPYCTRLEMMNMLVNMLNESHIPFDVQKVNGEYFVFPKGALELDDALIAQPLEWLKVYPLTRKAFVKALKEYSDVDEDKASSVADDFRKALETFLQEFFGEEKTLESLIPIYGKYLKDNGVPKEIRGNFETLLSAYNNFNNAYAKQHDKTELKVLEYIMYQTGNIIRFLITLKTLILGD